MVGVGGGVGFTGEDVGGGVAFSIAGGVVTRVLVTGALVGSLVTFRSVPWDSGLLNLMHAYESLQLLLLTSAAIWSHSEGMICKQNGINHDLFWKSKLHTLKVLAWRYTHTAILPYFAWRKFRRMSACSNKSENAKKMLEQFTLTNGLACCSVLAALTFDYSVCESKKTDQSVWAIGTHALNR
jgi:hypothetical protein